MKIESLIDVNSIDLAQISNRIDTNLFNKHQAHLGLLIRNITIPSLISMDIAEVELILRLAQELRFDFFSDGDLNFDGVNGAIITFMVGKKVFLENIYLIEDKIYQLNPNLVMTFGAIVSERINDTTIYLSVIKSYE